MTQGSISKFIAAGVVAALILTTPGIGCYEALAQARATAGAPVEVAPGMPAVPGRIPGAAATMGMPSLAPAALLLPAPAVVAPAVQPAGPHAAASSILPAPKAFAPAARPVAARGVASALSAPSETAVARPQAQAQARWAGRELERQGADRSVTLGALFEAGTARRATEDGVAGTVRAQEIGLSPAAEMPAPLENAVPSPAAAQQGGSASVSRWTLAAGALAALALVFASPATWSLAALPLAGMLGSLATGPQGTGSKESRSAVGLILALGAAAGAASYFGAPAILAFAAAHLPGWFGAWTAAHPILALSSVTGLGALSGLSLSQWRLWKEFPRALWDASATAAATTFRVWAMAGLRFDSALRGRTPEDSSKLETPANILKYPLLAWPFVLGGYVFTPVAFGVGFLYKAIATPLVTAWKGLKQLAVEFFPWLVDLFDAVVRALGKAIPFALGASWGGIKAIGIGIAVGAVTLARPLVQNVLLAEYTGGRLPGWIGFRLTQGLSLVGIALAGIAGGLAGLALSPLYALTYSLREGLRRAQAKGRARAALDAWFRALQDEEGFTLVSSATPQKAGELSERVTVGAALARLVNMGTAAFHALGVFAPLAVVGYFRSWARARAYLKTGELPKLKADEITVPTPGRAPRQEPGPAAEPKFLRPLFYAVLGAFAGMQLYNWFLLIPIGLIGWPSVAAYAVTGLVGAGAGLAFTRRKAITGYRASIKGFARELADSSFRFWARTGLNADAALKNAGPDKDTYLEAPASIGRYPYLAWPGVVVGYVSWAGGLAAGALWQAAAVPAEAAWDAFVGMLESFMPFLRRLWRVAWRAIRRAVPFAFGVVFGTIAGEGVSAWTGAKVFTKPFISLAKSFESGDADLSRVEYVALLPVGLVGLLAFLSAGVAGLASGLVFGIPAALATGLSLALRWAKVGGRTQTAAEIWLEETGPAEAEGLGRLTRDTIGRRRAGFWRAVVQLGNVILGTLVLPLTASVSAVAAALRGTRGAWRLAGARAPGDRVYDAIERLAESLKGLPGFKSARDDKDNTIVIHFKTRADAEAALASGRVASEMEGYRVRLYPEAQESQAPRPEEEPPAEVPASGTPVAVTVALGVIGLAGGALAPFWAPLPALGLAALIGVHAAAAVAGSIVGLALSQPKAWLGAWSRVTGNAKESASIAFDHWRRLGRGFDRALRGIDGDTPRRAGLLHEGLGLVASVASGVLGAAYGAALSPLRAAGRALRQIADELWPFLQRLWDFAYRLARRAVPFVFGWFAGAITGLVGSALFGALVVARPYFKYIVLRDFEQGGILKWLGRAALKSVAFLVAVVLGAFGLAAGILIALPYALTLMPSMAFQWADIGGPVQRFFDLWTMVRLREEMRRVDAFTGRMEFPEQEGRPLPVVEGWIRMANLAVFSLVAPFATLVIGLVGYFRSIARALRDTREGKQVPPSAGYDDAGVAWKASRTGAKQASRWAARLGSWGGGLAGLYVGWKTGLIAALWKSALWGFIGLAGGWLGGLILGALIGFGVGMIVWLGRQLGKEPADHRDRP